ncbi:hypothetical protein G6514_010473 [Epicoccum nigrum]|nr:hypothetical protein G6514_010473 [Epicoccum nigrum]
MVIEITSDQDLPRCINTAAKQAKKARELAHAHSGIPARKAQGPRTQGFFSRTMIVTLQTGDEVVIQFQPEVLDIEPFKIARTVLGSVVPDIGLLEDEELEQNKIWAYWMTRCPGKTWFEGIRGKDTTAVITINRSLRRILSRGRVEGKSSLIIEQRICPHLQLLLASQDDQICNFHGVAHDLLDKLEPLAFLPPFISHFDLNEVNILIGENCEVTGIIDWELSACLPFGMGFSRIHTLAGEYSAGKFHVPPEFEDADRGFWQEIYDGISADTRKIIDSNIDAVQTAVTLGTLLNAFQLDEGNIGLYSTIVINALPKLLSYRIPLVRGSDSPYAK